jgi:hypothetical protein
MKLHRERVESGREEKNLDFFFLFLFSLFNGLLLHLRGLVRRSGLVRMSGVKVRDELLGVSKLGG